MKVPEEIFKRLRQRLWTKADEDGWTSLSDQKKIKIYDQWSADKDIGGVLGRFMEKPQVRLYLKDTLMKPYVRARTRDATPALKALGMKPDGTSIGSYEKPHGIQLFDKRVVCWGEAREWKNVLLAVYERAYRALGSAHGVVLFRSVGKMAQPGERAIAEDLAKRLGIKRVEWLD